MLCLNDVSKLKQVREHVKLAQAGFDGEVVPLVITHFATPEILVKAEAEGILVIQSYEWNFDPI